MAGYGYGAALILVAIVLAVIARPQDGHPAKFLRKTEWLVLIYPAIVLCFLAMGVAQVVVAVTGG